MSNGFLACLLLVPLLVGQGVDSTEKMYWKARPKRKDGLDKYMIDK